MPLIEFVFILWLVNNCRFDQELFFQKKKKKIKDTIKIINSKYNMK